jgi:hypothetical protein
MDDLLLGQEPGGEGADPYGSGVTKRTSFVLDLTGASL